MKWASAISDQGYLKKAIQSAVEQIRPFFSEEKPDLLLAFLSPHYQSEWQELPQELEAHFSGSLLLGSSGGGIIGGGRKSSGRLLSLTAASLPGENHSPPLKMRICPLSNTRKSWKTIGIPIDQNLTHPPS